MHGKQEVWEVKVKPCDLHPTSHLTTVALGHGGVKVEVRRSQPQVGKQEAGISEPHEGPSTLSNSCKLSPGSEK